MTLPSSHLLLLPSCDLLPGNGIIGPVPYVCSALRSRLYQDHIWLESKQRFQEQNPVNKNAELPSVSPDHMKIRCPEGL